MSESITARSMPPESTEDHEIYVMPLTQFSGLIDYCIDRKKREESWGPLKYTDCVAIKEILENTPRTARAAVLLPAFGTAVIREIQGSLQVVFKGNHLNRGFFAGLAGGSDLRAIHYGVNHPKVRALFKVMRKPEIIGELVKDTVKSVRIAFFLWVGLDVIEELLRDHWSLARLGVNLASDMVKTVLAAAAGLAVGVLIVLVLPETFALLAVAAVAGMFVTSVAAGFGLEWADQQWGVTTALEKAVVEYEDRLKQQVGEKIDYWRSLVDQFERDVEFTLNALRAAREGAAKAKEYWERTEKFLRGIPELGEFIYRLP
jgi:hypothetical protein